MLRQALKANPSRRQVATTTRAPAPTGGWNAIDPLATMKPEYAVVLDNWIPKPGYIEIRRGSRQWVVGSADPVQTLIPWRGAASGVDKLFACAGTGIFETSTFGAGWPASSHTISSPRVRYTAFSNSGGEFAICANGVDTPFAYDGATWTNLAITGSAGPITLDPKKLDFPESHKYRLFFVEAGTMHVWFLPTNDIQGQAQLLDLGPIFKEGGTLAGLGTWSNAVGVGPDAYLVAFTTEGEAAIFQGDDPSNQLYWTLVGVFRLGNPVGDKALVKFGGDLLIITTNGVISFNQAIQLDRGQQNNVALTQKIQNAFSMATASYKGNFGWDGIIYPFGALAIFNIPAIELTTSYQYVQNLQTGGWCRFIGLDAFCWENANDKIFFGTVEGVHQWDIGVTDSSNDLLCELVCAYNYFGNSDQKNFTMVRPILMATANITPAIDIATDFHHVPPTSIPTVVIDGRSDVLETRADWNGAQGVGFCGAVHMHVILSVDPDLQAILAIGDGNTLSDGAGNDIATDSGEPLSADIQFINADIIYQTGGPL